MWEPGRTVISHLANTMDGIPCVGITGKSACSVPISCISYFNDPDVRLRFLLLPPPAGQFIFIRAISLRAQ